MSDNTSAKKVIKTLSEDKAKRDASYEYGKGSIEPVAEGAFKGALGSSIASRVLKSIPKTKKVSEAAIVGAGTLLGAVGGKVYSDTKANKAEKARKWLEDKKKSDYSKKNEEIYKKASRTQDSIDGVASIDQARGMMESPKVSPVDMAKGALLFGGASAAMGGLGSLAGGKWAPAFKSVPFIKKYVFPEMLKAKAIANAAKGGAIGVTAGVSQDVVNNASLETEHALGVDSSGGSPVLAMTLGGAAAGASEPIVSRAIGKYVTANSKAKKTLVDGLEEVANKSTGSKHNILRYLPFGGGASSEREILEGVKRQNSSIFKGIGSPTLKSASRTAIAMGMFGYGISKIPAAIQYLTERQQEKAMQKTASMSGKELIRAKKSTSKDILDSSYTGSIARKGAIAGLGYLAGRKMFGTHGAGAKAAGLTLAYSIPKLLHEAKQKNDAKSFLNQNKGGRLATIQKEEDGKIPGARDMIEAYVGARLINSISSSNKTEPKKKKYNINDSMGI